MEWEKKYMKFIYLMRLIYKIYKERLQISSKTNKQNSNKFKIN